MRLHLTAFITLCPHPTADVLGAVDDPDPEGFRPRQEPHRRPIDQRDVVQIQKDPAGRLQREQLAELRGMLAIQLPAQDEDSRAVMLRPLDSVGQRMLRDAFSSNTEATRKLLILFMTRPVVVNLLRCVVEKYREHWFGIHGTASKTLATVVAAIVMQLLQAAGHLSAHSATLPLLYR
jgi:hypothetical protein